MINKNSNCKKKINQITDLSYLVEMADGDKSLIKTMIDVFLSQVFDFDDCMHQSLSVKDWAQLGATAHKAKSSTRTMGMQTASTSLENLEHLAKGNRKLQLIEKKEENWNEKDRKDWQIVKFEDNNDMELEHIPSLLEQYSEDMPIAKSELLNFLNEI
ncbi:MAG: Hpt domain-containing protein [Marinifilaceae bacterium]|jgi:HPt (histidine-containing phosphotransfer) domain-containing protein|nr:Hpt domain-containing protein [Marinifilaceae bacterium]